MPEIIEVRKYADFIRKYCKNKEIIDIKILNGRYKKHKPFEKYYQIKNNLPLKIVDVKTKGKLLYIIFDSNIKFYILSTLGLSGGWCYFSESKNKFLFSKNVDDYAKYLSDERINTYLKKSLKHLNIEFKTNDGSLYFFDMLSFGTLRCIEDENELNKILNKIGPDIMDISTHLELFTERILKIKNLNKYIGLVLLNQKIISGIGNYLRADILYLSKISPFRKVKDLNDKEIKLIYNNAKILTWGNYDRTCAINLNIIKKTTKLAYDYDRLFFVYNQETDIYGNKVMRKELYEGSQKKFIYYVLKLQK